MITILYINDDDDDRIECKNRSIVVFVVVMIVDHTLYTHHIYAIFLTTHTNTKHQTEYRNRWCGQIERRGGEQETKRPDKQHAASAPTLCREGREAGDCCLISRARVWFVFLCFAISRRCIWISTAIRCLALVFWWICGSGSGLFVKWREAYACSLHKEESACSPCLLLSKQNNLLSSVWDDFLSVLLSSA